MSQPLRRSDRTGRGILLVCVAVFCFTSMNTLVKLLAATYPVPEIVWARYTFHLVLLMVMFPRRTPGLLAGPRRGWQVTRSALVLLATVAGFTAVSQLPLAQVISINFVAPLFVTALSVVFLQERVGLRRWAAVAVGFAGVLIIVRPGFAAFHWAMGAALAMALAYASYQIVTRMIAHEVDVLVSVFYTAVVGAVAASLVVPFFWVTPTALDWLALVVCGVLGGLGHFALIAAFERAEASVIAPFAFTEIIWATLAGLMVFGNLPDAWTFVGAGIIVASNLYVLHRERRRAGAA